MNQNKLVCVDLDGTLLNDMGVVSNKNKIAIKQCLELGFNVTLVTGRPHYFAESLAQKIDKRIDVISYNGASYKINEKKTFHFLNNLEIQYLLNIVKKYKLTAYFKTLNKIYTNGDLKNFNYQEYGIQTIKSFEDMTHVKVLKVIVLEDGTTRENFQEVMESLTPHYSLSYYDMKGFELGAKDVTKGMALKKLMKNLDFLPQNTYVFGDEANDLSMFKVAGHRIAPQNAATEVKQAATFISKDNNHSSIAYALKHLKIL